MFLEKYEELVDERKSVLCVGLDLRAPEERILEETLGLVEKTCEHAIAYKLNTQFLLFPLGSRMREIVKAIKEVGCLAILDHKLGDIESSNEAALLQAKRLGFDALTVSPFPWNLASTLSRAKEVGIGTFTLVLMSNPEAQRLVTEATLEGKPLYLRICEEVRRFSGEGVVVGATAREEHMMAARQLLGSRTIFLIPGLGAQRGSFERVKRACRGNVLLSLSRTILASKDPSAKAAELRKKFSPLLH